MNAFLLIVDFLSLKISWQKNCDHTLLPLPPNPAVKPPSFLQVCQLSESTIAEHSELGSQTYREEPTGCVSSESHFGKYKERCLLCLLRDKTAITILLCEAA